MHKSFEQNVNKQIQEKAPPVFDKSYSVSGILSLPYAEVNEPFDAWYDASNKKSRIDYYGGKKRRS